MEEGIRHPEGNGEESIERRYEKDIKYYEKRTQDKRQSSENI